MAFHPHHNDPDGYQASADSILKSSLRGRISSMLAPMQVSAPKFRFVPLLGCIMILLNDAEFFFKQIAMFRAIEAMYCVEYYNEREPDLAALGKAIPESWCKADWIQKNVATTYGLMMFCRMLPCIFTAIPLGYLADKAGRRIVLILHKSIVETFIDDDTDMAYPALPIWMLYISAVGALVGANFDLGIAMLFASYTDVMPSAKERSTLFFVTTSMQYVGQAGFPIIAGRLINLDGKGGTAQVSLAVSLAMALLGLGIVLFLFPETLPKVTQSSKESEPLIEDHDEEEGSGDKNEYNSTARYRVKYDGPINRVRVVLVYCEEVIAGVGAIDFMLLLLTMFCTNTAIKSIDMLGLVQYPVMKLGWSFSDVTFVTSIQALVYVVNYLILLPGYTRLGIRFRLSDVAASLSIMLFSSCILIIGSVCLGFSATSWGFMLAMAVYTLGTGLPVVAQALISSLVEKDRLARVLSALSIFAIAGKLAATSIGPVVLSFGIDSGKESLKGALFFFSSALFFVAAVTISLIAARKRRLGLRSVHCKGKGEDIALDDISGDDG